MLSGIRHLLSINISSASWQSPRITWKNTCICASNFALTYAYGYTVHSFKLIIWDRPLPSKEIKQITYGIYYKAIYLVELT